MDHTWRKGYLLGCLFGSYTTGHQEAAETSVLEAQARNVPGALLERCKLLWDRDKGHRAVMELQLVVQQQLEEGTVCSERAL